MRGHHSSPPSDPVQRKRAVHNLIGPIRPEVAYVTRYGKAFPELIIVGAYDKNINNDATDVVSARSEAAHKSKRADCATYATAVREMTQFVLTVVANTWVRELRDSDSLYTEVYPKDLFAHLQAG